MRQRGFSLVEVAVVICIVSVLITIAVPRCADYLRRERTSSQTRSLYADLMQARANAIYQRRTTRVKLYRDRFEVYSSQVDNAAGASPVLARPLAFPITSNGGGSDTTGHPVEFDPRGLADARCSVCVVPGGSGALDSVVISSTRLSLGRKDLGNDCKDENITRQ